MTSLSKINIDFETYSEAGFTRKLDGKLAPLKGATKRGLTVVGAAVYARHPSTRVLSLAYGESLWIPGLPPPVDLIEHIKNGGLIQAWNSGFEWLIWNHVCTRLYSWTALPLEQMRCTMAQAKAHALPGKLAKASEALGEVGKIEDGKRLIDKFSIPRNVTKLNPTLSNSLCDDLQDAQNLYDYNLQDVVAEIKIGERIPAMPAEELEIWKADQAINMRGCAIDLEAVEGAIKIIEAVTLRGNTRLAEITGGKVDTVKKTDKFRAWLRTQGLDTPSLDIAHVATALDTPGITPVVKEALEIRVALSKSSTAKTYAFRNMACDDGRIRELLIYCGASRTKRWAGSGVQPQNLPNRGPEVQGVEWNPELAEKALEIIKEGSLEALEGMGDALEVIAGCLRGLFISAPGHDLISSDFSAIEAVVLAELAGETWRQEVFRTHGRIYEMSAAKITGIPMGEERHSHRKLGKLAELASGYQGSVGAWKRFGADEFFDNEEAILAAVKKWRRASPAIAGGYDAFGQWRDGFWKNLENAAISAVRNPGQAFQCRLITYQVSGNVLYCKLPSGGLLAYHQPQLRQKIDDYGREGTELSYMNWNTNPQNGPVGWFRTTTYGGKLTENAVQATARDIQAYAIVNLEKAGYPIVLHVHDEICSEVREGVGSIEELERIMSTMPLWASDWPIKAVGGWRGKRYRK